MTVLADRSIADAVAAGVLGITPFDRGNLQPASYDLAVALDAPLVLEPGVFHLLRTEEALMLPDSLQGEVHGRSSLGRLGVLVHFTAGYIDPGFRGTVTLEVMALAEAVTLRPGDRVCQVSFRWLDVPARTPYRGRYQGQVDATPSRFRHADEEDR